MRRTLFAVLLLATSFSLAAQTPEYRGYWAETFNTPFATRADADRIVEAAAASNANAIFIQVRRRGDAWYLDAREPLTEQAGFGEPDATGRPTIDPLRYLIDQAHARAIEVHAFVIIGTIYNSDPAVRLPSDPRHVFLQHFWDASAGAPYKDSRQWATRALPHNPSGTTYDGQRFASEWYVDLGHPDAAAYTAEVLTHLVRQYALDGIHLDRIRYPEAPIDAGNGMNVGYNATSVARFNARYGTSGNPATTDPRWNDWRREQVTNFVRRLYLNVKAVRPSIRVSAALICFSNGPGASGGFENTEAYYRVFQNWKAWTEEGILDAIAPMDYKRDHIAAQQAQFDDWMLFATKLARDNGRLAIVGMGAYLNAIESTLRQARRIRAQEAGGMLFYSLASTNDAVSANPFSYPTANQSTPRRPDADFYSALRTGTGADGSVRFEPAYLLPLFGTPVATPANLPAKGHLMGTIAGSDGLAVTIENLATGARRTVKTDGGGFFGAVHLDPGTYRVTAQSGGRTLESCAAGVNAGLVTSVTLADGPCSVAARRRAAGR
jgi:uncharacterized lipoprotein YddW (UPF0748 family)